jgi:sodium-coupled neutral amino acid transporter 11
MAAAGTVEPKGASVPSSTVNLAKNIVGAGVLALASGVSSFSSSRAALPPALAIMLMLCSMSGYTFSTIARVGNAVGADSYRDTWAKVFGESTAIIPAFTVTFKTLCGALAYSIIVGDSFASIGKLVGGPALLASSNFMIVLLTIFVFLPLCLMRNLSSLAIGSVIGTAGTVYTALFMSLRAMDGSYAAGGKYHAQIAKNLQPSFATAAGPVMNLNVFVLVSMLATAFLAHYNAPKFFKELAGPEDGSSKLPRFNQVVIGAFGLAALLCGSIMAAGFSTFGAASQGFILNNYATADSLALLARIGISASIIFSFPLNFVGLREGVLDLLKLKARAQEDVVHRASTVLLLATVSTISLFLKDLGLVVAFGGAILGSGLVYIFPALMFLKHKRDANEPQTLATRAETGLNIGVALSGVMLAAVGGTMTLKKAGII